MTSFTTIALPASPPMPDGLTHMLRTPLGALVAALEVAGLPGMDAGACAEAQAIALRQANRLAELLEDLDSYVRNFQGTRPAEG
jgi:signal transduction histidine kinase